MKQPERQSSLAEWLAWLETLHPKKIDLGLARTKQVLHTLGIAVPPFRVITVGGTNGKGSSVAYLSSVYSQAGYRVGAFTSPHLVRFNERIVVAGAEADDEQIVDAFATLDEARGDVSLSYFEASTVAALLHFARSEVDIAVLEVGLGGRLDAVNAIDCDAALIVSIDLDHQEWLGNDRDAIGIEKAGIVRAARPVVIADPNPPQGLVNAVAQVGADALYLGQDFTFEIEAAELLVHCIDAQTRRVPAPRFGGREQQINAAACVQLIESLRSDLPVPTAALRRGIAAAAPAGRADRRQIGGVEWVFDVAHNPAAARCLSEQLAAEPAAGRTWAIFAAMRDKDIAAMLLEIAPRIDTWYVVSLGDARAADAIEIVHLLRARDAAVDVHSFVEVASACAQAKAQAAAGDRIVVFGSFYLVGPALSALELYFDQPGSAP